MEQEFVSAVDPETRRLLDHNFGSKRHQADAGTLNHMSSTGLRLYRSLR